MTRPLPSLDDLAAQSFGAQPGFLSEDECRDLRDQIASFRAENELPAVYREAGERPLHYNVIDGERINSNLPDLVALYERVNELVNEAMGEKLEPLEDRRVGLNVNITPIGGSYRWHYDRNAVTAILYLNAVEGGETEVYPNYRLYLEGSRYSQVQRFLDRVTQLRPVRSAFGKLIRVAPETGLLMAMRGNRCLHSVRPVEGEADRINVIMSYDHPGASFDVAPKLDKYLYEAAAHSNTDPNYR